MTAEPPTWCARIGAVADDRRPAARSQDPPRAIVIRQVFLQELEAPRCRHPCRLCPARPSTAWVVGQFDLRRILRPIAAPSVEIAYRAPRFDPGPCRGWPAQQK